MNSPSVIPAVTAAVLSGETTASALAAEFVRRAHAASRLNAFLTVGDELAAQQAASVDAAIARGERALPLAGVCVAVKDNLCVRGLTNTCASKILGEYRPFYDATVIERLVKGGAIVIGKTNLDEFAMGSSGENSAFGPALNPHNPARVPGGSSSGSAVAVAAGAAHVSLGSDTGGSIRQPASFCGVVGFKPTYSRVSRRGLVAFASSLDQIGPFAAGVEDAARLYQVMAGYDAGDSTSNTRPVDDVLGTLDAGVAGLRIGLPKQYFAEGLDPEVKATIDARVADLVAAGASVVEVDLPSSSHAVSTYYVIACAEASSNLARFDGVRFGMRAEGGADTKEMYSRTRTLGFGPEVRRRIMLGTFVLSSGYFDAYYRKAQQVRTLFIRDFERAFAACDVLLAPTAPTPAFAFGDRTADPLAMYLADIYTIPANLAGLPAISVPAGVSSEGLPIGLQVLAPNFGEQVLFRAARAVERAAGVLPAPAISFGPALTNRGA